MAQQPALIDTLKRVLKMRGITYRILADELGMSEASVKRMFSIKSFSLERLEQVCDIAGTSFVELVKQMDNEVRSLVELSEKQEQQLVADAGLLLVAFLIINGHSYQEIEQYYLFKKHELIKYLTTLDKIKLIELLPNNRFHLLISANFMWRKNGPIQRFFTNNLQQDFLNSRFKGKEETLVFLSGGLSSASRSILLKKIEDLCREFNQCNHEDMPRPMEQRHLTSMIVALRPWVPGVFQTYRNEQELDGVN